MKTYWILAVFGILTIAAMLILAPSFNLPIPLKVFYAIAAFIIGLPCIVVLVLHWVLRENRKSNLPYSSLDDSRGD